MPDATTEIASGEKSKARDILAAIRTLKAIEREGRPATAAERAVLARFAGFGPVALSLFPHATRGTYKDAGWQVLGEELQALLTPEQYASARATVTNAYYTSPVVMTAMHTAVQRLGVPADALVLEPGCGTGNFLRHAPPSMRFIGIEKDGLTGRIARALHPGHDIRIEPFQESRLPPVDAVIGNPPFADVAIAYHGRKLALHDFFIAKSLDALRPGGILALVTTHFTLDKQNAGVREQLAEQADFLGAIRLPSDAFKREGTSVVTDIVFLRKRADGQTAQHADPDWLATGQLAVDGAAVTVNRYFLNHPEMVLGVWSRQNRMYAGEDGYSVTGSGNLAEQLAAAVERLPESVSLPSASVQPAAAAPPFVAPPDEPHLTEGSLFIGEGRVIRQLEGGQAKPVVYGGVLLKADGTPQGRRIGQLIELKQQARRVLRSQNEGWPEPAREAARRELNRLRDRFVSQYGPINKTTFTQTRDGSVIRRMPNLVKFREDPDAMLVMALEQYDETAGKAEKAAILLRDVVGPTLPVTSVASAEEGLLACLDQKGAVDIGYMAQLYGKSRLEVIAELGDLIYRDPQTQAWQTADEYLSGNVRAKLAIAEAAGRDYAGNAEALRAVQPEDVLPGDIDVGLGAPWVPDADIQAFAAQLFHVEPSTVQLGHLKQDAVWTLDAGYAARASVAATSEYGTLRANGTSLLELALNQKSPTVYDPDPVDPDKRVVNQEATLAAREKQRLIKERFRAWVFADPEREERLVRVYNDTYNNLRPRAFDGSHLAFPGMSTAVTFRQSQRDAVWRCMTAGNTLSAHVVGGGKTWIIAAAAMKMKQTGLRKKCIVPVPNHMLEQFAREWMQLYPNARLLVAGKDDFTRERRKLLTAKIATGDWDGIIVTHSGYEHMGMSTEFQEAFLRDQIAEYERLLIDKASSSRNIIKAIEKQKAAREERLKGLLARDKKDDGLVFDELGIDQVFYDEVQACKNLETPTKMERVAGLPSGGSERAFDFYMKCRYLDAKHPGHGIVGASGTPISNSMVEMYTMQRYFDLQALKDRGIEHFDAWAATFGEVEETMEIAPDGLSLKPRSRFARFVNLPELTQMFRSFADVQTAEMLKLPRPDVEGGKPIVIACPMSPQQKELQAALVKRYDRIRNEKVDPREDNALAITTDGRKLALDPRLLSTGAEDFEGSKLNAAVANVARIWKQTEATRGTQMLFCDMGVHPTAWGYCVYDDVIAKLVAKGIPADQIAVIGDADSDAKKQALFERVRQGSVRVLIGSTQKMGVGTNVQKRLVALHHLDAPWKPAEVEQRDGRILRQGNDNAVVAIYRYVTEGSFDAYMWQALEVKARFIAQVMTGELSVRRAEDIGGQELSYAEVKAIASGNPAVLTLAQADAELQRLAILKKNHDDEQYLARKNLRELPETIDRRRRRLDGLTADVATLAAHVADVVVVAGRPCPRAELTDALAARLERQPQRVSDTARFPLGVFRGLAFGLEIYPSGAAEVFLEGAVIRHALLSRESRGPRAVLNALERLAGSYAEQRTSARQDLEIAEGQRRDYEARLGAPFPHESYLTELTQLRDQLKASLSQFAPEAGALTAVELADQINRLTAAHSVEAAPLRLAPRRSLRAEEPVTTRIRKRRQIADPPAEAGPTPAVTQTHSPESRVLALRDAPASPEVEDADKFTCQSNNYQVMQSSDVEDNPARYPDNNTNGGITMTRSRKAADAATGAKITEVRDVSAAQPADRSAPPEQVTGDSGEAGGRTPIVTPDPRPLKSASLREGRGAPRIQLLRSHRYKQMQIRSDEPFEEKYLVMLRQAGWTDRTEEEGIWTKQAPLGMWQPVADAERLFEEIANGIRADRGLPPVLDGLTAA